VYFAKHIQCQVTVRVVQMATTQMSSSYLFQGYRIGQKPTELAINGTAKRKEKMVRKQKHKKVKRNAANATGPKQSNCSYTKS